MPPGTKTYYELLELAPSASPDEIKKAFRREIARYHPDKVEHLGQEFQEIATVKTAELMEAYRVLADPGLRADYDGRIARGDVLSEAAPRPTEPADDVVPPAEPTAPPDETPPMPSLSSAFRQQRASGDDFVRRAAIARFRDSVGDGAETVSVEGFEAACIVRPRRSGLFKKGDPPVWMLARFVPRVDAEAVQKSWSLARRAAIPRGELPCVLVIGDGLASPSELAGAVARERHQDRGTPLVLVPVDVRNWEALMPTDAPSAVRSIIDKLRNLR